MTKRVKGNSHVSHLMNVDRLAFSIYPLHSTR